MTYNKLLEKQTLKLTEKIIEKGTREKRITCLKLAGEETQKTEYEKSNLSFIRSIKV